MIENKCTHEWQKHTDSSQRLNTGAIPAYYICKKCRSLMTAPEVFQLEALENQDETLRHLKGFQTKTTIITLISSSIAVIISIISIFIR